jgi:hypothetical protein
LIASANTSLEDDFRNSMLASEVVIGFQSVEIITPSLFAASFSGTGTLENQSRQGP